VGAWRQRCMRSGHGGMNQKGGCAEATRGRKRVRGAASRTPHHVQVQASSNRPGPTTARQRVACAGGACNAVVREGNVQTRRKARQGRVQGGVGSVRCWGKREAWGSAVATPSTPRKTWRVGAIQSVLLAQTRLYIQHRVRAKRCIQRRRAPAKEG